MSPDVDGVLGGGAEYRTTGIREKVCVYIATTGHHYISQLS